MKNTYTWLAMLAVGASALVGCVVEDDDVKNTDGGVAGAGGTSGGTAGTGGATAGTGGATAGTGGATAGTGGTTGGTGGTTGGTGGTTGGTGGTGGTPACYDDTTSETVSCAALSYAETRCDIDGTEYPALGLESCEYTAAYGRLGVHEANFNCLNAIAVDPCSTAHDDAVEACLSAVFPNACDTTATQPEGGTCADVGTACPALGEAGCAAVFNAFTTAAQEQIITCFDVPATEDCVADFEACVFGLP